VKVCAALRRAILNLLGVGLDELPDLGDVRVSSITGVPNEYAIRKSRIAYTDLPGVTGSFTADVAVWERSCVLATLKGRFAVDTSGLEAQAPGPKGDRYAHDSPGPSTLQN
jgi:hypothetical protein